MKFELIIITAPDPIPDEAKRITQLFMAGLKKLHVRKPGLKKQDLRNYLSQIPKKYRSRVVIHSHYSLIDEFSLGGIHLTERTRKKKLPGVYNKGRHSLSASFHSMRDINRTRRKYDYVFLSPIFNSISKKGYKSAFKQEDLGLFLSEHKHVIALGGIDEGTLSVVKQLKFGGAAMLGCIWQAKDPVKTFGELRSKIK